MRFTLLGTGTSQGVPIIGCNCKVCRSSDPQDKRLRTSLLIESEETSVCIDIGPDFRYQLLREDVRHLDAVVITHEHNDHIAGLDEVRALNFIQKKPMPVYCTAEVENALRRKFYYVFENSDYPGVPRIQFIRIGEENFKVGNINITPIQLMHADMPVLGFRIGDFAYITDANYISEVEQEKLRGVKYLVFDALRREKHHSHFSLSEAVEFARKLSPDKTWFTHVSHQMGLAAEVNAELPENMMLAYDGLVVEVKSEK